MKWVHIPHISKWCVPTPLTQPCLSSDEAAFDSFPWRSEDSGLSGTDLGHQMLSRSVFLSLALPFSLCVCVGLLVCMKAGRGLSPTAVVTQLCLVYIRSDNSGSKHRSPYADVPLMAFKHVCGSACLCVKMDCCTCMNLCFSASILHPHSKCFFKHPLILPSCLSVFLRGVCYYVSQWGAKKLLLKHGLLTCHSSLLTAGRGFLLQNMCVCAIRLLLSIFSFSSVSFHSGTSRKSFRNDAANRRQALH